ncbi:MAG TPA: adenylyltransferase/cytidyltransferase family protein [Propionibacteriaceae bacterium]|nr:adenylyltransferase/cytidyltransferase family protein [Propionibacteriaceae bacterium]
MLRTPPHEQPEVHDHGVARKVIGYVPGGWDMFHIGHLNLLRRARGACDYLIVGVVTDEELARVNGRQPVLPLDERMAIVGSIGLVDRVVVDYSTSKLEVWNRLHFDVLFKGDDGLGTAKGEQLQREMASVGAGVHLLPYTTETSSSELRRIIVERNGRLR